MVRGLVVLFCAAAFCGCSDPAPAAPGPLEIGTTAAPCLSPEGVPVDCSFRPIADGDTLPIVLGVGSMILTFPSLRSADIDPHEPDSSVSVTVDDLVIGAELPADPVDMVTDGTGYVLWNVRVSLQTDLCCFMCREALVDARLTDAQARTFRGSVRAVLSRGACPDPGACCDAADACPDPLTAQLCE